MTFQVKMYNENSCQRKLSIEIVHLLRHAGFDIKAIGVDNPSISDKEVIEIANKENRTIITFDKDYGELIYKHGYRPKAGVIYLRFYDFEPEAPGVYLLKIFEKEKLDFEYKLTVIDRKKIRQRKY